MEMRRTFDGMQTELNRSRYEEGGGGLRRGYDDGPSGYAPRYCGEIPPALRRQYDDGLNAGGGFAL